MAKFNVPVMVLGGAWALALSALFSPTAEAAADGPKVIMLTQVGCQFIESEDGVDLGFKPKSAKDCETINARTGKERLTKAKVLSLKPGKYIFGCSTRTFPTSWGSGCGIPTMTGAIPSIS